MRRCNRQKHVAMWLAAIMVITMIGCANNEATPAETADTTAPTTETVVVEPEPEVIEPEVTAPEQEDVVAEPESEVEEPEIVEEDNPNIIDGIDFTKYNNREEWLYFPVSTMHYDSLRILVVSEGYAEAILKDGDHFEMKEGHGFYSFEIYVPKEAKDCAANDSIYIGPSAVLGIFKEEGEFLKIIPFEFTMPYNIAGTDIEIPITVTYEDGTEETITVYITKEYVTQW